MSQQMKACPQCKTLADLSAQKCAKCGHTYRTQFRTAVEPPVDKTQMPTSEKTQLISVAPVTAPKRLRWYQFRWSRRSVISVSLLAAIVCGASYGALSGHMSDEREAWEQAKDAVRNSTIYPPSAVFPPYDDRYIDRPDAQTFTISAYVDAQNGAGAMIRQEFVCTERHRNDDKWAVKYLKVGEQELVSAPPSSNFTPVSSSYPPHMTLTQMTQIARIGETGTRVRNVLGLPQGIVPTRNSEMWEYQAQDGTLYVYLQDATVIGVDTQHTRLIGPGNFPSMPGQTGQQFPAGYPGGFPTR